MLSYPFLICLYLTPCASSRLYAHWDFVCGLCTPATNSACEYVCNCYPKLYYPRICLITFISCLSLPSLLLLPPLLVLRRSLHQSRPTRRNGRLLRSDYNTYADTSDCLISFSLNPHTVAHVRYDLAASLSFSCTIRSSGFFP